MNLKEKRSIDIRKGGERFRTRTDWLDSRHSFSFGNQYDPDNVGHGLLIVNNDDIVLPGTGFMTHPHRNMEILTWVLEGELEHQDSEGNRGVIYPGLAQRMSAGRGIWHSEINPSKIKPVRFIQMWVLPDTERIDPGYEQLDVTPQLEKGGMVLIASGKGDQAAIFIRQKGAALWGGKLKPGEISRIPDTPFVHLYVTNGMLELENSGVLQAGDAVRLTSAGSLRITADSKMGANILIWETIQNVTSS